MLSPSVGRHARFLPLVLFVALLSYGPASARLDKQPPSPKLASAVSANSLSAPKWLAAPALDGQCDAAEYSAAGTALLVDATGLTVATAKVQHSGIDLYLCFDDIPLSNNSRAVVRLDTDHDRTTLPEAGDYQFSVTYGGALSTLQGSSTGAWVPITVPARDFAAVAAITDPSAGAWSAELRLSLDWLGGYARTDGLSLAIDQVGGPFYVPWPSGATPSNPATWGDLVLEPLYPSGLQTGSVFLDGRDGYLVVPYGADLNPSEITIEAWVKIVDGDCGTLAGNGRLASFWLAFCQMIQFGYGGEDTVSMGQQALGDGWHHVAVTMGGEDGIRTFYLDGQVDLQPGWKPAEEEFEPPEPPPALGASDRMLRIGSDRDAPAELDKLHAYVADLRIWNVVRTADQIRAAAFQRLGGTEPGLVADWTFAGALQDITGRHAAGLVGNAALAREARDVTAFSVIPPPPAYTYPPRLPIPAWRAVVPERPLSIKLDGVCSFAEYPESTRLTLEPDRMLTMRAALNGDALYLCTGLLYGSPKLHSAVTLWIDRTGLGGTVPGPADLRLQLLPDGSLTAGTGDGTGYTGPAPGVFASKMISDTKLALQEDAYWVNSPWWESELRIPLAALAPFQPGQKLHFAVRYEGTVAPNATPGEPGHTVTATWPASFDGGQPRTWGAAGTEPRPTYLPLVTRAWAAGAQAAGPASPPDLVQEAAGLIIPLPEQLRAWQNQAPQAVTSWPRNPPDADDFYAKCPEGAAIAYLSVPDMKWPEVDPGFGIVQSEGEISSFGISNSDSPLIHTSHDMDMQITVAYEDRWRVLDGGSGQNVETESAFFDDRVLAGPGDHVTTKGRWIFDCGHDPKTEIHPAPIFEVDRTVTLPDGIGTPGKQMQVRDVRVHMSGVTGPFLYSLTDLGPFTFSAEMPYGYPNQMPFVRVVQGPAGAVALTGLTNYKAQITITPPGSVGPYDWELYLGYLDVPSYNPSAANARYIVTLDYIQVLDDHDSGAPDCNGLHDCGEWTMWVGFNRDYQKVWDRTTVYDGDDPYPIGRQYRATGGNLYLGVVGYEDDDPLAGDDITTGEWNLGSLASLCCGQYVFPAPDWQLWYTVSQGDADNPTALPMSDSTYWLNRLGDEPNSPNRIDLGQLAVPATGAGTVLAKTYNSYLTQSPLVRNNVRALSRDLDQYSFSLDDFAVVTFDPLPTGVQGQVEQSFPWDYAGQIPAQLANLLGYRSAWLKVSSTSNSVADQVYSLKIRTAARELPPDWGEPQDVLNHSGQGGRPVDLLTPDPATDIRTHTLPTYESRDLTKDWAWQHIQGDIDYYDIHIPPVSPRPSDKPFCEYEVPGALTLSAPGMNLWVPGHGGFTLDEVVLGDLNTQFPLGHVYMQVRHPNNLRGFYRLEAKWNDAGYLTVKECDLLRGLHALAEKVAGMAEVNWRAVYVPSLDKPDPAPGSFAVEVRDLGGMQVLRPESGGTYDAVISSVRGQPVLARVFSLDGVLLGEGKPLGEESAALQVADGQIPQSHLVVDNLSADQHYLVQITPLFDVGPTGTQEVRVGFTQSATGR